MSGLINSAMSGLNAAQTALNTTSNNISNYYVPGYNRQIVNLAQNNSTLTGGNYIGNGVAVTSVTREFNQFITNQLQSASSQASSIIAQQGQMSSINNMLSSTSNTLDSSMQGFFNSLQSLVSNASDPSARQAVLGKAEGMVNQFQVMDSYLKNSEEGINGSITSSVDQINNYAKQIANLNKEINKLKGAAGGTPPNALLDQRDQLVSELNKLVGVKVTQQDGDSYNITIGKGISLVNGDSASELAAVRANSDQSRVTVAMMDPKTGKASELPEGLFADGSLGGLLKSRHDVEQVRNQVGQMALALADSFNTQHKAGVDSNGDAGKDFFGTGKPKALANASNTSGTQMSVEFSDTSKVQASDYEMKWDGSSWSVTRQSDNAKITATAGQDKNGNPTLNFDGLQISVSGNPDKGESFTVKPVSDVVSGMSVKITDEAELAAAGNKGGASNNENAKALLELQTRKVVGGKSTLTQAYASMVADVGNKTNSLNTAATTQSNLVTQLTNQQQSVSGVNLDEEYTNLARYQQYYMANAQVLQTASTIFDALIGAVR